MPRIHLPVFTLRSPINSKPGSGARRCTSSRTWRIWALSPTRSRSRTIPSLVAEATRLAEQGVVELNLVSQDSTAYGRDLRDVPVHERRFGLMFQEFALFPHRTVAENIALGPVDRDRLERAARLAAAEADIITLQEVRAFFGGPAIGGGLPPSVSARATSRRWRVDLG